jgi:hypothetical protein
MSRPRVSPVATQCVPLSGKKCHLAKVLNCRAGATAGLTSSAWSACIAVSDDDYLAECSNRR